MHEGRPKKLTFRFARLLEVFPLSGEMTKSELVKLYNDRFRSRIMATLKLERLFGVLMTDTRMERLLKNLVLGGYLSSYTVGNEEHYVLTALGVQAKHSKKR